MKGYLLGFRKFTLAIAFVAVSIILLAYGYFDGKTWAETSRDVVVAFMGTNLGERLLDLGKEWVNEATKRKSQG